MNALQQTILVGATGLGCLIATAAAATLEGDLSKLQGKWRLVAMEVDGSRTAVPPASESVIEGNRCTTTTQGQVKVSTLTVPERARPKQLDATDSQGQRTEMIYRLEQDKWIVCATLPGTNATRPTEFQAAKDSQRILFVYRSVPR